MQYPSASLPSVTIIIFKLFHNILPYGGTRINFTISLIWEIKVISKHYPHP